MNAVLVNSLREHLVSADCMSRTPQAIEKLVLVLTTLMAVFVECKVGNSPNVLYGRLD